MEYTLTLRIHRTTLETTLNYTTYQHCVHNARGGKSLHPVQNYTVLKYDLDLEAVRDGVGALDGA